MQMQSASNPIGLLIGQIGKFYEHDLYGLPIIL